MKKNKHQNPILGMIKFFLFLIIILVLVQIFIAHRLVPAGKIVNELEIQADKITQENKKISELINRESSLSTVFEKAQLLGYKPIEKIVYITSEIPIAMGH